MVFFKSKKNSIISDYFNLLEDIGNLKSNNMYDVALYSEYLEIKNLLGSVKLKYEQITDVYYGNQEEIIKKDKSIIGRAVIGGLLLGGVGSIVGAISGIGEKTKKVNRKVFIISYTSSSGNDAFILFEDTRLYKGDKVANKLKELCNIQDIAKDSTEFL